VGFTSDVSREFIEVPDGAKGQLLYKWPDHQIRRWTNAIVDIDELALFVRQGRVVGTLPPGRHNIDATELPFLGDLIDKITGGKAYDSELFFVSTREFPDLAFGGPVDSVRDPETKLVVRLRGFGEYSLRVVDPIALILHLTGTVDLADSSAVVHWVSEQVFKAARTVVIGHVLTDGWPVLGLAARTPVIEAGTLPAANTALVDYGLQVTRLGNLTISVSDEDAEQLRNLARDTAYTSLAGSFGAYAQGEALLGAGEGMAHSQGAGGETLAVAALGIGSGVVGGLAGIVPGARGFVAPPAVAPAAAPVQLASGQSTSTLVQPTALAVACVSCHAPLPDGAAFCPSCGASTAVAACAQCGHSLDGGAKFCSACGAAAAPAS
jgi:membrane protease subunit (stomatin/prohibitin family)